MRALVIDSTEYVRQVLVTILEAQFGAMTAETASQKEAIEILNIDPGFDLLILGETSTPGENPLMPFLQTKGLKIPVIICSDNLSKSPATTEIEILGYVDRRAPVPSVNRILTTLLGTKEFHSQTISFCGVSAHVLRQMVELPCDLFIKLSDKKFVRIKPAGDAVEEDFVLRYREKNIHRFYIKRDDAPLFLARLLQHVSSLKTVTEPLTLETITHVAKEVVDEQLRKDVLDITVALKEAADREVDLEPVVELLQSSQKQVSMAFKKLGFSPDLEVLIKASVKLTLKMVLQLPELAELFKNASKDSKDYFSSHSTLLAYISCALGSLMGWDSDFTRYKLCLASYLHDILLNEEMAKLQTLAEAKAKLSEEDLQTFSTHPAKSADLVLSMSELPPDVDRIVLNHHERPDGTGFPYQFGASQLSPLSSVFILAHDLVRFILERQEKDWSTQEFLSLHKEQYNSGHFKKITAQLAAKLLL